jgi:branched-chain amino acid transport system ATP-binding protein
MLVLEGVVKTFDKFMAVAGARLTVEPGTIVAVIGPNGAGKTTLFNLITGQLKPDRGRILLDGEDIAGLPAHAVCKRGIARAFQIANIFPRLTVFENVQVAVLAQQGLSANLFRPARRLAVAETERILESVGLAAKARHLAGTLSHGDQRILEVAVALGSRPRLLILDEPTGGMSPEETLATLDLVRRLAAGHGLTILFSEHDMDVVFSVAESIMVMRHGRTLIQAAPDEVRHNREVQEAYLGGAVSPSALESLGVAGPPPPAGEPHA